LRFGGDILLVGTPLDSDSNAALKAHGAEEAFYLEQGAWDHGVGGLLDDFSKINNELAALERTLAQKNAALQRVHEQMTRFLGMAAHDLRNPLGVIRNFAELLLEDTTDPDQAHGLESIRHSASFMQNLVDDLLDSAQLESGRIELTLLPVALGAFVGALLGRMRPFAEAKRIRLVQAPSPTLDLALADAMRLEQVLVNLLTNAFKFSLPDTQVTISWAEAPGAVAIIVTDQGPGIPARELAQLFEPFVVTSVRASGGEKSTGLGLWIARRIMEAQGGRIDVSSEVGRGTAFTIWLRSVA
jgi:signal transduction histidine kinase